MRLADRQAMDDYLLSDPADEEMLLPSIAELDAGEGVERGLIHP